MDVEEITGSRLRQIWLSYLWRAILIGFLTALLLHVMMDLALKISGHVDRPAHAQLAIGFVSKVVSSFIALALVFRERFDGWAIRLVKVSDD